MALSAEDAKKQAALAASGGAQTFPEGAQPGPGLQSGPVQTSAPLASGNTATEGGTPASDGANGSQAGGVDLVKNRGTPDQMADKMPAGELESSIERSAAAVANGQTPAVEGALPEQADPDMQQAAMVSQKDKVNQGMRAVGADPEKALTELRDKRLAEYERMHKEGLIDKKVHTKLRDRWKNIFNIIPKEDMGLVLMDFGFRAMMAGESMGSAAAIGAAGSGALAGVQQRQKSEYDRKVNQFNMADKGAREDLAALQKPPDTINAEQGIYEWSTEEQRYVKSTDKDTGETLMPSALAARPPVDKWKIDRLVAMGVDPDQAARDVLYGVNAVQATQRALDQWAAFERDADSTITVGGNTYSKRDVRRGEIPGLKEKYIEEYLAAMGFSKDGSALSGSEGGGSGGGGGNSEQPLERVMDKPAGMSKEDWIEYNDKMDALEKLEAESTGAALTGEGTPQSDAALASERKRPTKEELAERRQRMAAINSTTSNRG